MGAAIAGGQWSAGVPILLGAGAAGTALAYLLQRRMERGGARGMGTARQPA
jgi:hypothetical protein